MFVYKFLNFKSEIIYIGKTKNIHNRMKQHFEGAGHLPDSCYLNVNKIFFTEVDGKTNVDMYETFLINKYRPIYNTEKKFNELLSLHINDFITIEEVDWKELFFMFSKKGIITSNYFINYPFFKKELTLQEKGVQLIEYNYYQLIHREGLYTHYIGTIFNEYQNFLHYLISFHEDFLINYYYENNYSCFDEPLSKQNDAFEYAAININDIKNKDIEKLFAMIQCKMLVRLSPDIYGIVAHTPYALEQFNKQYRYNEFEHI